MTAQVHQITDLPKTASRKAKIGKGVAIGIFAAGTLLLIDDQVKKLVHRKNESRTDES